MGQLRAEASDSVWEKLRTKTLAGSMFAATVNRFSREPLNWRWHEIRQTGAGEPRRGPGLASMSRSPEQAISNKKTQPEHRRHGSMPIHE